MVYNTGTKKGDSVSNMYKVYCDRCGEYIQGAAYHVYVYAEDVNGGNTCESAVQNLKTNLSGGNYYCPDCVNKLRKEFKF